MTEPYRLATVMPAAPHRPRWVVPAVAALVLLLLASIATVVFLLNRSATPTPTPTKAAAPFAVGGTVTLQDGLVNLDGLRCEGYQGFSDLTATTQVVVTDSAGKVIAAGVLGQGLMQGAGPLATCKWVFIVKDVPGGLGFYGIEVGHRGRLQYDEAKMHTQLDLSIG